MAQPNVIKREEQKGGRSRRKEHEEGTKEKSRNELKMEEAGARDEQDNLLIRCPGFGSSQVFHLPPKRSQKSLAPFLAHTPLCPYYLE